MSKSFDVGDSSLAATSNTHIRRRFVALDGLRGVAAFVIVFWHAQGEFAPIPRASSGYLAVDFSSG